MTSTQSISIPSISGWIRTAGGYLLRLPGGCNLIISNSPHYAPGKSAYWVLVLQSNTHKVTRHGYCRRIARGGSHLHCAKLAARWAQLASRLAAVPSPIQEGAETK